jgi:hypothetical protein
MCRKKEAFSKEEFEGGGTCLTGLRKNRSTMCRAPSLRYLTPPRLYLILGRFLNNARQLTPHQKMVMVVSSIPIKPNLCYALVLCNSYFTPDLGLEHENISDCLFLQIYFTS